MEQLEGIGLPAKPLQDEIRVTATGNHSESEQSDKRVIEGIVVQLGQVHNEIDEHAQWVSNLDEDDDIVLFGVGGPA